MWSSGDHPDYSIYMIGQNIESSGGVSRKFYNTQTPFEKHLLTLVWKNSPEVKQ